MISKPTHTNPITQPPSARAVGGQSRFLAARLVASRLVASRLAASRLAATALVLLSTLLSGQVQAEAPKAKPSQAVKGYSEQPSWTDEELAAAQRIQAKNNPEVELRRAYVWGVNKYALDHATRVTGWQVGHSLYFGRAKGEDSGLALVWQRKHNQQMSLSNDGLRFTRRF